MIDMDNFKINSTIYVDKLFRIFFCCKAMETEKEKEKGKNKGYVKGKSLNYFFKLLTFPYPS